MQRILKMCSIRTRVVVMMTTVTVVEPLHGLAEGTLVILIVPIVTLRVVANLCVLTGTGLLVVAM